MADIGMNAAGRAVPPWVDTIPWQPSGLEPEAPAPLHTATGSTSADRAAGSFRIGIVHLLATVLGVFYPWATLRPLRCFHRRTRLGGQPFGQ